MITHEEFIKKHNLKESDYYQENGWLYILNLKKEELSRSVIKDLPSKIKFTKDCNSYIILSKNIKKTPPDVIFNNKGCVRILYVEEISENVIFNNDGNLYLGEDVNYKNYNYNLGKLKKIHPSVKFTNNGYIYFSNIINKIPSEIVFNNIGDISIYYVKEISENVTFENDGNLFLGQLEKVHPSVKFINKGNINFDFYVNKIPKGMIFNNNGNVYTSIDMEYISEDVIFNNEGDVILNPHKKPVFSKGVKFNNKGNVVNIPINIPEFLDPKKYLNKMIEQIYK